MDRDDRLLLRQLGRLVGAEQVLYRPVELAPYESDALTAFRARPRAVVLPETREQVVSLVRFCHAEGLAFVARGSGTSLSGGSLPVEEGIVITLSRLDRILSLDPCAARAVVEPGVVNLDVSRAGEPHGLYYAPDPSSQSICTLGGNVAFNSGGAHCLKHGMTSNHVLGLEVVLADGTSASLGGRALDGVGPDLPGIFVGSEGLFGVALEITLRLLPRPERYHTVLAAYERLDAAGEAVAAVLGAGLLPGALEIMDRLAIEAAEAAVDAGYPRQAGGLLIVELEGEQHQVAAEAELLARILATTDPFEVRVAGDAAERERIWKGRKGAFSAVGRLSPDYLVQDGVVPRTRLGEALATIERLSTEHGLRVANVFHAGDGNLHPLILYDGRRAGELGRAEALAAEILRLCIRLGGSITGEHGIGVEKREFLGELFGPIDLETQYRLRQAMDPVGIANPGKGFPLEAMDRPASGSESPTVPTTFASQDWSESPATPEEVAERVRCALAEGIRLRCRGGGSKPALSGVAPEASERCLELAGLSGILEHDPDELTITVAAGTGLATLAEHLAEHGQELPFEPPLAAAGATVGGTLASGLSGPGRLRHGGLRDFLLGVRFVDGLGALVRGGGKVVKNAAGFDLPKLLVGSQGRLGVLVEATFKVFPRPEHRHVLRLELEESFEPWDLLRQLALSPLELDAVELEWQSSRKKALWLRIAALGKAVEPRLERLARKLETIAGPPTLLDDEAEQEAPWHRLSTARELDRLVYLPLAPGQLETLAPQLDTLAESGIPVLASAAGQTLWLGATGPPSDAEQAAWQALATRLEEQATRALVLRGEPVGEGSTILGPPLAGPMLERVCQALDPHGVFGGWG